MNEGMFALIYSQWMMKNEAGMVGWESNLACHGVVFLNLWTYAMWAICDNDII